MTTPLTFSQYIDADYELFKDLLMESSGFDCDTNSKNKLTHSNVYKFKELFSTITLNEDSQNYYLESINGQIEFFWLISLGKYKLASMALRGAMENFSQGLMHQFSMSPSKKFSENMDRSIKEVIESFCQQKKLSPSIKKSFGKDFRTLFLDPFKNKYWDLCDIVHSRDTTFNSCREFLEDVLKKQHNDDQADGLLELALEISEYILVIFYYSNYSLITTQLNHIKLDLIVSNFSSEFHKIKKYTI